MTPGYETENPVLRNVLNVVVEEAFATVSAALGANAANGANAD